MTAESKVTQRTMRLKFADGAELLVVQIEIDCPSCGQSAFAVAGEHIATVIDILTRARDSNPDLCAEVARITDSTKYGGAIPSPEKASMN